MELIPMTPSFLLAPPRRFDRLEASDIHDIVEDAIKAGVLDGITLAEFNYKLDQCRTRQAQEDFIQTLWDRL